MSKLTIVAHIRAKKDKIEVVKQELLKLIELTRAEEGCIDYDLHQDNEDPAYFMFYENWDTRDLWQIHMNTPHLKQFMTFAESAVEDLKAYEMTQIA